MNKRSLILLFIMSFVSVIFTLNNLCYKYIDNKIDTAFIVQKYHTTNPAIISKYIKTEQVKILTEVQRLSITLGAALLFLVIYVYFSTLQSTLFTIFFIIAYFISYKTALNHFVFINITAVFLCIII